MKTVRVIAAVIRSEDKIFATARGYGEFKGQWEFPGGKIEPGETPQEALVLLRFYLIFLLFKLYFLLVHDLPTFMCHTLP